MSEVRDLIGTPYKVHGRSKEEGFDCYGVIIEMVKRDYGIELPDVDYKSLDEQEFIRNQIHTLACVEKIDNLQEKCIIELSIRGIPMHVGYYIGDGMFIHSRQRFGTIIEPVSRWKSRIMGVYKVKNSNI